MTAGRVVDFLDKRDAKVIVHGLSVGGYLTQRVLMGARDSQVKISHLIFDSFSKSCHDSINGSYSVTLFDIPLRLASSVNLALSVSSYLLSFIQNVRFSQLQFTDR